MPVILPPVANVVRFTVKWTFGAATGVNTFYFRYSGAVPTVAEINTFASSIVTVLNTQIFPNLSNALTTVQVDWVDLTSVVSPTGTQASVQSGDKAGSTAGAGVACCVSWKIARRYRGGHPRTYFAGIVATDLATTRTFQTAFVTAMQTGANNFRTNLNGATFAAGVGHWEMVCVHYFRFGDLLPVPIVDPITSATVNNRIDSQRRRLGK